MSFGGPCTQVYRKRRKENSWGQGWTALSIIKWPPIQVLCQPDTFIFSFQDRKAKLGGCGFGPWKMPHWGPRVLLQKLTLLLQGLMTGIPNPQAQAVFWSMAC